LAHGSALAWTLLALALVAALGLAWLGWRRWPWWRRRRSRREPRLRHPVVLAHGLLGFDAIELGGVRRDYFLGLPALLAARGCAVHSPRLGAVASIATRAEALAACVRALPDRRVNVVAHSMGGLDARYAVARLGLAGRVASLTTVGTPHTGTPLADLGAGLLGEKLRLRAALERCGVGLDALYDLTTERMAAFNAAVPDVRGVAYGSVVGVALARRRTHPLLLPGWLYLRSAAGENDGLVPGSAQRWGEVLDEIDADHWAQIGWSRHFDAAAFFERLFDELRGRGF
jgi:triacylglycerol lipase